MMYNVKKPYIRRMDELMYVGIPLDRERLNKKGGDFASLIYVLKEAEK